MKIIMKTLVRLIVCLVVVFSCSSCITAMIVSSSRKQINNIDSKNVHLTGKTLQKVGRHGALMVTEKNDVVCIILDFEEYYDGMRINDHFRRYGTYEYFYVDGTLHYAPIFVRAKDFKKYQVLAEELSASKNQLDGNKQDGNSMGI